MKINWKIRFKNKAFVTAFFTSIIAFVYQMLGMFEVVPPISEDMMIQVCMIIVNVIASLGIVVDPTTSADPTGISDSQRALTYTSQGK